MAKRKVNKKVSQRGRRHTSTKEIPSAVPTEMIGKINYGVPNMVKGEKEKEKKRLLIFTPTTGLVRIEWVQSRYAQFIPQNWSFIEMRQFLNPWVSVDYQLADAQNLMAKEVVEGDYEWIIYIEQDNVLPQDAFLRMNEYMVEEKIPVVSGLYFLKSDITEPLMYRGRGNGPFTDWKLGDKAWVDGIPFGFRLEHASLIKAAWEESEEIVVNGIPTRRVFAEPNAMWLDEETGRVATKGGTTDLAWCDRLMNEGLFTKAGWPSYQKKKYPFLVDTNIFVKHIDHSGVMYPLAVPARYVPPKGYKGKIVN